jgi:C-terminal processing protease CtpA/Prc
VDDITTAPAAAAPERSAEATAAAPPKNAPIQTHRKDLEGHPNWIVDVRGNGGGSDSSYAPLLPWLMPDGYAGASTAMLATPANIEGWTRICGLIAPGGAECPLNDSIARMRQAPSGTYVTMDGGDAMFYGRVERLEPHRPVRVAILIDGRCGSSCEQFALEARQSFSVKLIGQHTFGSLDYANVRQYDLPSGKRRLSYATTRSTRIPGLMVDVAGIQPDIYLPVEAGDDAKSEEVRRVQTWLEGGSLEPGKVRR